MDRTLLIFKKAFHRAHESPHRPLLENEGLFTAISMDSTQVLGVEVTPNPSGILYWNDGDVEYVRLELEFIEGTDTPAGRHGFACKLPADYESNATNERVGAGFWINGQRLYETGGEVQIVPVGLGGENYQPRLWDRNLVTEIGPLDERDWMIHEVGGMIYQENPLETGDSDLNPAYLDCWIYIGPMTDEYHIALEEVVTLVEQAEQEVHRITVPENGIGYFVLPQETVNPASVRLDAVHGVMMVNKATVGTSGADGDFEVINKKEIHFNGNGGSTGLSGLIQVGEQYIVTYQI